MIETLGIAYVQPLRIINHNGLFLCLNLIGNKLIANILYASMISASSFYLIWTPPLLFTYFFGDEIIKNQIFRCLIKMLFCFLLNVNSFTFIFRHNVS